MDFATSTQPANAARLAASPPLDPKSVRFELVSAEQHKARLPMRVQIYPHDSTESIVATVKNFFGLYSSPTVSKGVSFEDEQNNTLIAQYENFRNDMVVYVRVIEELAPPPTVYGPLSYHHPSTTGAQSYLTGEGYAPPAQQHAPHISRPGSRTSRLRSPSPNSGRGRRSASTGTNSKARSRSSKTRAAGSQDQPDAGGDSMNGYSSGDGAPGSASGKNKDQIGNTEISVDNIVEGGRRKRAKFESSVSNTLLH